nr:MAG TPA: hypothetical protein [Microviridae sp.]
MKGDMYKVYTGIIKVSKFFGIKAGRSIWKECYIYTRPYQDSTLAFDELKYLRDSIVPALGAKIICYQIETSLVQEESF